VNALASDRVDASDEYPLADPPPVGVSAWALSRSSAKSMSSILLCSSPSTMCVVGLPAPEPEPPPLMRRSRPPDHTLRFLCDWGGVRACDSFVLLPLEVAPDGGRCPMTWNWNPL
jgi:hypothetical protein